MYKTKSFREKVVCAIVSTFLIFVFADQLLLVDANLCQKSTMADFRYIPLKSWKIDNIDLTQQFSLSIFTDFHCQSMKITWLLSIFMREKIRWLSQDHIPNTLTWDQALLSFRFENYIPAG